MAIISPTSLSPTSVAEDDIEIMIGSGDGDEEVPPKEAIIGFVNNISDILEDVSFEGFVKITEICEQRAYRFRQRGPGLSLADALRTMLTDQNSIIESHPKVYYFYQVMTYKFLQKCIKQVDPENGGRNADDLLSKMYEAHAQFMDA